MNQKSIAIAAILAAIMLTAVFTTAPPFSLKSAEGQLGTCPVGYERSSSGICVPITRPPPDTLPTSENRTEQNIVCSGWSYTCG
jgi:hypothetical protein